MYKSWSCATCSDWSLSRRIRCASGCRRICSGTRYMKQISFGNTIIRIIFSIVRIILNVWAGFWLILFWHACCWALYNDSFWKTELRAQLVSHNCCQKWRSCDLETLFYSLFYYFINYFATKMVISKLKIAIRVHIHCSNERNRQEQQLHHFIVPHDQRALPWLVQWFDVHCLLDSCCKLRYYYSILLFFE